MPAALGLLAFNVGLPLGVVNAITGVGVAGAVLHTVVGGTLIVGGSVLAQRLLTPQIKADPSRGMIEFQQTKPSRFFYYGRNRISGPLALLVVLDSNSEITNVQLNKIVLLGSREYEECEKFSLNDEGPWTFTAGYFAGQYIQDGEDHVAVQLHLGSPDQTADAILVAGSAGLWTTDHRLRGIPYAILWQGVAGSEDERPANFMAVYGGNGQKEFRGIFKCAQVYDPRKDSTNGGTGAHRTDDPSTWEFSDNQRLCTLDWLTYADGYGKSWDRIDWASWVPQIDLADEDVALKAGGTEKRYRVATKVSYDEPKGRVLRRLLEAGDQQLYYTDDGLIGSRGGEWVEPDVTLTAERMPEFSFAAGVPLIDRRNEFALSCMLPSHGFVEVDLEPYVLTDDPAYLAGIIRKGELALTQVPSHAQAQRLAKIYASKANAPWIGQVRTDFSGLHALNQSVVALSIEKLGFEEMPFFIDGKVALLADRTGITFGARAADPTAYDWDEDTEETDPPPIPDLNGQGGFDGNPFDEEPA